MSILNTCGCGEPGLIVSRTCIACKLPLCRYCIDNSEQEGDGDLCAPCWEAKDSLAARQAVETT